VIVSEAKIDSVKRSEKMDTFTGSYVIENTNQNASYRFLVRSELGVMVQINFSEEKTNIFQPLAANADEILLKAGEKRAVSTVIDVTEKEYAQAVGAVTPPQLKVFVIRANKE
jgi:hypothetical protein